MMDEYEGLTPDDIEFLEKATEGWDKTKKKVFIRVYKNTKKGMNNLPAANTMKRRFMMELTSKELKQETIRVLCVILSDHETTTEQKLKAAEIILDTMNKDLGL